MPVGRVDAGYITEDHGSISLADDHRGRAEHDECASRVECHHGFLSEARDRNQQERVVANLEDLTGKRLNFERWPPTIDEYAQAKLSDLANEFQ